MGFKEWLLIIAIIGIYIIFKVMSIQLSRTMCPKCKKRNCTETKRQETSRQQVLFEEEEVIKTVENKNGYFGGAAQSHAQLTAQFGKPDSTTIRKYKVPGERIHYRATYKCNECGNDFTSSIYEDVKPPTVR